MIGISSVRGVLALVALCTTTACGGAETVTVTVTVTTVASTAAEATGSPTSASPPTVSTAAAVATGTATGELSSVDEEAGREFAAEARLLTALCLNGSPVGYPAINDVVAAANTLIRIGRKYPNAVWNHSRGEPPLADAMIDVGEQVAPCYPDVGKRLTSAGKRLKR
jgi:hypothetical protein